MLHRRFRLFALIGCLALAPPAFAIAVSINTDSAKAVLEAMQNPALSHDEALKIAEMRGNQGIIRKLDEFKIPATAESFADALYTVAHGEQVTDSTEKSFYFETVKPEVPQLLELIKQIETNPQSFQTSIEQRIALFTPPHANIHLDGYIVAGGDGGGYAFGDTDFYLNIGIIDEFAVAKGVATHELYHAVQGAFAKDRSALVGATIDVQTQAQKACETTIKLFANLYEEGSAVYVEDISLLSGARSAIGLRKQNDVIDGLRHIHTSVSLLEMSVVSLGANPAVPYDDVYEVGFYGHAILYNLGYLIAKAVAESDGPQGLAVFLNEPPYKFVLHYTQLRKYGADDDHPRLGPNTVAAANQLASGCK
jgi:Putative zinc dependent peptidase (DUF5700)